MAKTKRTPKGATPKRRRDWRPAFLKAFELEGTVFKACQTAKVGRSTVYQERQRNEDFALAWADIEERTTEMLEREAFRRAAEGTEKPVYQGGKRVGSVREFSDTLTIFLLKGRRPEKYRDNVKVEHAGKVKHEHTGLEALSDDELLDRLQAE